MPRYDVPTVEVIDALSGDTVKINKADYDAECKRVKEPDADPKEPRYTLVSKKPPAGAAQTPPKGQEPPKGGK